jgi:hypothetical protein
VKTELESYDATWGVMTSDKRLKYDIHHVGKSPSGIPTYTFKYREEMLHTLSVNANANRIYFGAMAQDLCWSLHPMRYCGTLLMVITYSKIDMSFYML